MCARFFNGFNFWWFKSFVYFFALVQQKCQTFYYIEEKIGKNRNGLVKDTLA